MKQRWLRLAAGVTAAGAIAVLGAGCSEGQDGGEAIQDSAQSSVSPPDDAESVDPQDVQEDDTDYSVDAGNDMPEYEYEDGPPPAEELVATLCNLNQEFVGGLRVLESGSPVVDDNLRTNLVGLSDLLVTWESLRPDFPDVAADIDRAKDIYAQWDLAVLSMDNGDPDEADAAMRQAEEFLAELPEDALNCNE